MRFPGLVHFGGNAGALSNSRLSLLVAEGLEEALAAVRASVLWHGERATVTVTDGPACRGSASDKKINGSIG